MLTLHADLTQAQQAQSSTPYVSVELTSRDRTDTDTYTTADAINRILSVQYGDGRNGGYLWDLSQQQYISAVVRLQNNDNFFSSLDYRGYRLYIRLGYMTASGLRTNPSPQPFIVIRSEMESTGGVNQFALYAVSLWEFLRLSYVNDASSRFLTYNTPNPGDAATVADILHQLLGGGLIDALQVDDGGTFTNLTSELTRTIQDILVPDTTFSELGLPGTPAVDDAVYFGLEATFDRLSIRTRTAAANITVTWEYYDGSSWTALSNVTDNTNSFQTAGYKSVAFDQPTDWATTTVGAVSTAYYYIRARVTSVGVVTPPRIGLIYAAKDAGFNLDTSESTQGDDALPRIETNSSTTARDVVVAALAVSRLGLYVRSDGFHAKWIDNAQASADYTYDLDGAHGFYIHKESVTSVIPNTIIVASSDPRSGFVPAHTATAEDAISVADLGAIVRVIIDENVTADTVQTRADTHIYNLLRDANSGEAVVPVNVGQEPHDLISIVDIRTGRTVEGRLSQFIHYYEPGVYRTQLFLGGADRGVLPPNEEFPIGAVGGGDGTTMTIGEFNSRINELLGRPYHFSPGYPYVHKEFGQKLWASEMQFLRANFGSWVTESLASGGLVWSAEEDARSIATYWNVGWSPGEDIPTYNPVQVTDVMYVQGTGALFGREQVLYGAFLARMAWGNYRNEFATNATPSVHGTADADVHGPPGQQNLSAAHFNSSNQSLTHADNSDLDLDTGDFTIEATVNPRSTGAAVILGKYQDANNFYKLAIDADDELYFQADIGGSTLIQVNATAASRLRDNRDYHVVVVVDRDTAANTKIYMDGTDVTDGTPTVSVSTIANTGTFSIGVENGAAFWDGRIRHVRLWKGDALSATEVGYLYNAGYGSFVYAAIQTNGAVTTPSVAWDLAADANDEIGSLNLTNNNSVTFGGDLETGAPTAGEAELDVNDPYLWLPQDYFGILFPRWVQIDRAAGYGEHMMVSAAGAKAQGTITLTDNPSDGDTITIGDKTYTFESGTLDTEGEIAIGADYIETTLNIACALIRGPGSGTRYQAAAAHPQVTAEYSRDGTVLVTAKYPGTRSDAIVFSESASNLTMDGSGTLGGTTAGSDKLALTVPHARDSLYFDSGGLPQADETVTIDGIVYTWKAAPSAAYEVDIGANVTACRDNLKAAINDSGTAGTTYGTGTVRHPTCWAYDGQNDGTHRTLAVEALEDGEDIAVSESTTSVSWFDRGSDGTLHKLLLWSGAANSPLDVIDYVFKSFGFGNFADPNCCGLQIRDGRFELLTRSQENETRRVLAGTYQEDDAYLTLTEDPNKSRTVIVLWTRDFVAVYGTNTLLATQPDLLDITDVNIPYWPLEMDCISYWGGNNDIVIPWVEYYSTGEYLKQIGEPKRIFNGGVSGATDTSLYTVPANRAFFLKKFRSLLAEGTVELNDYDGQNDTAFEKIGVERELDFEPARLIRPTHSFRVTTDTAGTHAVSVEGVLI